MLDTITHRSFIKSLICFLSLIALSVLMMADLEKFADFLFWDEMEYELGGLALFEKINRTWGPFYGLWYKFLSIFEQDVIRLYYLNYRLTTLLPVLMLFLFLRRIKINLTASFMVSAGFLFSSVLFETWPKISHFCFVVIMAALLLSTFIQNRFLKALLFAATALVLSYARPEFYLAFMIILLYLAGLMLVKRKELSVSIIPALVVFVMFVAGVQKKMGVPLGNNDRIAYALVQHMAYNYNTKHQIDEDFWLTGNVTLMSVANTDCEGLYPCMWANKDLLIEHGLQNTVKYFDYTANFLADILIPKSVFGWQGWTRLLFVFLLVAHVLFYKQVDFSRLKAYRDELVLLAILIFPAVFSSFVIYPRTHYIILQLPFFFMLILVPFTGFKKSLNERWYDKLKFVSIAILLAFLLKPNGQRFDHHDLFRKNKSLRNVKTIEMLKRLNIKEDVYLLENDGGMNRVLSPNYHWVLAAQKDTTYNSWVEKKKVNMIYVTQHLLRDVRYSKDNEWNEFIAQPLGFRRYNVNEFGEYLLIKKDLLD